LDEAEAEQRLFALGAWANWWVTWIDYWRDKGAHEIPTEIGLAILMHESRGDPSAVSCSNAIGLMQVIPNDAILAPPDGCGEYRPLTFPENPSTSYLIKSRNNIRFGLDHLEALTWEGQAYVDGLDVAPYRDMIYEILPEASVFSWWYNDAGKATLAMYHCGPVGVREERCGKYGGFVYADDILTCWVPWVESVLVIDESIKAGGGDQK
jgi:hypothetical protein